MPPRHCGSPSRRSIAGLSDLLAAGIRTVARATAALHAVTSVETFMLLRRDRGLPLARVKQTLLDLARAILTEPH